MTRFDRMWLGGWIALVIGIADDNGALKILALCMFILSALALRWDK